MNDDDTSWVSLLLLVDQDAATLVLLSLGDYDGQDAVVEVGADLVVVDAAWELEGARELADAALRDPELVLGKLGLGLLCGCLALLDLGDRGGRSRAAGGSGAGVVLDVVLNRGLVGLVVLLFLLLGRLGDGAAHLDLFALLEEAGGRRAGSVGALHVAADDDGLRVGELDVDILLLDAGKLAVELVDVLRLPQVELGSEGLEVSSVVAPVLLLRSVAGILVEVIDETEEAGEVGLGRSVESRSEHRHFD